MTAWHKTWSFLKWSMLGVLLTLPLAGCLEVLDENAPAQSVSVVGADVVISGSVGDGPVIGATITVYSNSGEVLGSMTSDSSASFRSTLKVKGNQYPLRLVVSGGTDLVTGAAPDFEMSSVMRNPSDRQVNINPFSTLIVMLAERAPGGLSSNNVEAARIIVMRELGFGLDATAVPDPITAEITSANAANLVKASEALGEAIRRTRDAIMASGGTVSGDTVMAALAADLVDGSVDGQGGAAADALTASVANVVSAQVLVETLTNRLRIGGVVATSTIDQAIAIARPDITTAQLTESVTVTGQLIEQTRIALAAAQVLDAGTEVKTLATGVAGLAPGILPSAARAALPASGGLVLTGAANQVALASTTDQVAINQVVALDGSTPPPPTSAGNTPPAIGGSPAGAVQAGSSYQFQPTASDADGDSLSFSISGKPAWASFSNTTGRLGGTPGATDVGSYSGIRIAVTDGTDTTSLAAFTVQVTAAPVVNTPPAIGGSPAGSVEAGSSYQFQPTASDADGDSLSFSISGKPAWASFSNTTGRLSGTPGATDVGSYSGIRIAVTDGTDTTSLAAFAIQVTAAPVVNTPPAIGGSPAGSVEAGSSYQFQPTASDADGDSLSFSISGKPAWASFDSASGRLGGTPGATDVGSYSGIRIAVTDGTDTTSLAAFAIQVTAAPVVNTPPAIGGSPAGSVQAGSSYQFQPTASDADGDSLSFSISGKPAWASFDSASGRLGGTPGATDVGSYSGIRIAVTDGTDTTSLAAFAIQVTAAPAQTGIMTLSWVAPTQRADGTVLSLSEIGGYRLYYGTTPGAYSNTVEIADGAATTATITDLALGSYYVVLSTYDSNGLEGAKSSPVIKTVQ